MTPFITVLTRLCDFRKKTQQLKTNEKGNQSFPQETIAKEQTNDDLQNKETVARNSNASDDGNNKDVNPELPLPPARKAALQGTNSCNNMALQRSVSVREKLRSSLTLQMSRMSSVARKHDVEEDKPMKNKKLKAEKSILVRPIILGEKCRVLPCEEGDEDHGQGMLKKRIYPASLSSIPISRILDMNVTPVKETSEDLVK